MVGEKKSGQAEIDSKSNELMGALASIMLAKPFLSHFLPTFSDCFKYKKHPDALATLRR